MEEFLNKVRAHSFFSLKFPSIQRTPKGDSGFSYLKPFFMWKYFFLRHHLLLEFYYIISGYLGVT
jgi:hypothetical protein